MRSPTHSSPRTLARALLVVLPFVTACSSGVDELTPFVPNDGGALRRLELTALGEVAIEVPRDREAASWSNLGAEGAIDGWKMHATKSRTLELDGKPVLAIYRKQGARFEIPVTLTLRDTPQITFTCVVRNQGYTIRGELMKGGFSVSETKLQIIKAKNYQTLKMTFPPVTGESLECDAIVLHLPRGDQPMALDSLSIEDVALGGYLPVEAFGGFDLVEIGSDARRGTCISNKAGMRTTFLVENGGQELVFSYSTPRSIIRPGKAPLLRVTLEAGGKQIDSRELAFVGDSETAPAWNMERIALGAWVDQELSARFEVLFPGDRVRLAVLGEPQLVTPRDDPQTVLLVTSDTHRSDHLGFLAGEEGPRTQMLDHLASEGVTFVNATSSINNTTPSHVALFTGMSPRDTGIVANAKRLAQVAPTLAECFADLGYATLAAVSAAPVCFQFSGLGQGFDRYSNPSFRSARDSAETLAQLKEWIDDYEGRPLFVWLHLYDAHSPYEPPPELLALYYPENLKPRDPTSPVADPSLAPDWDPHITDPVYTESAYKGEVSYVDQRLAELLSLQRFWTGTIAFTADHGETLRNGGEYRFSHRGLSHSNLAVPMIFKAHDLPRGTQSRGPVQQIDVGRTLLDLAGHPQVSFPGRNVFDVPEDEVSPRFAIQANGFSASVLSGKWMLHFGLRPSQDSTKDAHDWKHKVALYNIEADESCQNDVSREEPKLTRQLRRLIVRWLEESRENHWQEQAIGSQEEVERQLSELGYVTVESRGASEKWIETDCSCVNCAQFE